MKPFRIQLPEIKGYVRFYELLRSGKKGGLIAEGHNIETTVGRTRVAELLTGESSGYITKMGIGDGGAPQADLLTPYVPTLSDTALAHQLVRNDVSFSRVGLVATFTATFLTASLGDPSFIDSDNKVYNEAGLFTPDGVMFARKTFPSVPFAPGDRVGVIGEWEVEIL